MTFDYISLLMPWTAAAFKGPLWWTIVAVAIGLHLVITRSNSSKLTLVNSPAWWQFRAQKQMDYLHNGLNILTEAKKRFKDKPYRVIAEFGEVTVIPSELMEDLKAASGEEGLSFRAQMSHDLNGHLELFSPFGILEHKSQILQRVTKLLTKRLPSLTALVTSECAHAIHVNFGEPTDWGEIPLKGAILDVIARTSSRVFLGEGLCRNEDWLSITKNYTLASFKAAFTSSVMPSFLRRILPMFDRDCKEARRAMSKARALIDDEIMQRQDLMRLAREGGYTEPEFDDSIAWAESESGGEPYDPTAIQLSLSFAAIHTTTNLLCQTLHLLAEHPEYIQPLREEIIATLQTDGWTNTALYEMKLLDSAIKESQRLIPNDFLTMRRRAKRDVPLRNGLLIRKGENVAVQASVVWDSKTYKDPMAFDIYRYKNIRSQPGNENKAQLATTSTEHFTFGHGQYSCPGRFFAANELKIILCHLLLKYDWKVSPGIKAKHTLVGASFQANDNDKIAFKRRQEEVDLEFHTA
ncbi:ent-kaurene oxidase [Paramyrothecium foliicola]|nr:ent-kaurene oxidase [Paramyrothecium foliicola]